MKRTSMYTAVLALSLAMALAGGGLACRTFRERLDALEEQAVLQHQRNVCGLEDAFAAEYDTRSGAGYLSSGADSVCARVGQAYTRGQWLILGSSTAAFALMREGDVAYSALPESVAAADVQQAAAATDGILLRGETLLLGGVLNTPYSYPVAVVTAADASEAFAARNRLLYSWLAVQAIITLAALVAAYHYERLQELNARQSRFVADLTHELKTPLTSLIGYADLLRGGTLDAERRRTAAEALYHESARLESLSQQLLALNGLQEDGVVLRPVRVAAAFADAVRSLPDVVLDCDAPAEAVVLADRVLLADLVRNLALNAWHAGPQDGAVHLRCTDAGECWRLTVQDTGCGIPAEALPHLTEPFYRVDKARARAMELLAGQELSSGQLYERLNRRYTQQTSAAVVAEMVQREYINDARYAETRAHALLAAKKSRRAAARNLRQKGLAAGEIQQALDAVYTPDVSGEDPELEAAAALVDSRYRKKLAIGRRDLVVAALQRRGFAYPVIKEAIRRVEEGE